MHFLLFFSSILPYASAKHHRQNVENSLPDLFENFINSQDFINSDLELFRSARNNRSGCRLEKSVHSSEELIQNFICRDPIARMWLESKVRSLFSPEFFNKRLRFVEQAEIASAAISTTSKCHMLIMA